MSTSLSSRLLMAGLFALAVTSCASKAGKVPKLQPAKAPTESEEPKWVGIQVSGTTYPRYGSMPAIRVSSHPSLATELPSPLDPTETWLVYRGFLGNGYSDSDLCGPLVDLWFVYEPWILDRYTMKWSKTPFQFYTFDRRGAHLTAMIEFLFKYNCPEFDIYNREQRKAVQIHISYIDGGRNVFKKNQGSTVVYEGSMFAKNRFKLMHNNQPEYIEYLANKKEERELRRAQAEAKKQRAGLLGYCREHPIICGGLAIGFAWALSSDHTESPRDPADPPPQPPPGFQACVETCLAAYGEGSLGLCSQHCSQ